MSPLLDIAGKYFWALGIIIGAINASMIYVKLRSRDDSKSGLTIESKNILLWYSILMIAPWLLMGAGIKFGDAKSVWDYFRPRDGDFWVWAWFGVAFFLQFGGLYWLWLGNGGETLVKYREIFNVDFSNPRILKYLFSFPIFIGITVGLFMCLVGIPIPSKG
ncbi:MAG: hypothetical protein GXP30_06580 [Verrucomicrobia bacterium]|nr:hypothetical protein [Verrucomicrobiota bacterium]